MVNNTDLYKKSSNLYTKPANEDQSVTLLKLLRRS